MGFCLPDHEHCPMIAIANCGACLYQWSPIKVLCLPSAFFGMWRNVKQADLLGCSSLLWPWSFALISPYAPPGLPLSCFSQFLNLQSLALHDGQLLWLCPWGRQVLSSPCASVEAVSWGLSFLLYSALLPLAKVSAQTKQAFKAWSLFPLLSILHCSLFFFFLRTAVPSSVLSQWNSATSPNCFLQLSSPISCSFLKLFDPCCLIILGLLRVWKK